MIEVTQDNLNQFRQTNRLICTEILSRNLRVTVPTAGSSFITIHRENIEPIYLYNLIPPNASFAAAMQADNKFATFQAMAECDLPVLPTIRVKKGTEGNAIDEALLWPTGIVIKPLNASHGDGITVNVKDKGTLLGALEKAYRASGPGETALLQKMYPDAIDLRFLCVDYKFVAAVQRIPARVFGNGKHTIYELIELENTHTDRGERYVSRLATIDIDEAIEYLRNVDQIDRIPADGEEVFVLGKANYGSGGETEDISNQIPNWLIAMAEDVAKISRLPLSGVDILVSKVPQLDSTLESLNPIVNEVNKSPSLYIHEHPTNSQGTNVTKVFIDYLLSL